jgi:hypothetical protein
MLARSHRKEESSECWVGDVGKGRGIASLARRCAEKGTERTEELGRDSFLSIRQWVVVVKGF